MIESVLKKIICQNICDKLSGFVFRKVSFKIERKKKRPV
jgi:hypothetical protein